MNDENYDVIIVGAGPGGSAAAASLAQQGWQVLLVDQATFPRDKVCGDFISPRSLRVLKALGCRPALEKARPNRLSAASLYLNGEKITSGAIPQVGSLANYGYVLARKRLDEIIFRRAQASGAETVEGCEVKDLENVGLGMAQDVYQSHAINLRQRMEDWIKKDPAVRNRLGNARMDGRIIGWPLNTYHAVSEMARQPVETAGWGLDVANRAAGVLNGLRTGHAISSKGGGNYDDRKKEAQHRS